MGGGSAGLPGGEERLRNSLIIPVFRKLALSRGASEEKLAIAGLIPNNEITGPKISDERARLLGIVPESELGGVSGSSSTSVSGRSRRTSVSSGSLTSPKSSTTKTLLGE